MKILLSILFLFISFVSPTMGNNADFNNENFTEEFIDFEVDPGRDSVNNEVQTYSNSSQTTYSTFLEAYYSGLTVNMGENYKNSCGYVALGMLLSYYDTFLNDEIIPEEYDAISTGEYTNMIERNNSPGIYHDTISNIDDLTATEYFNLISSMQSYSLHSKLMVIGQELNILDISDGNDLGATTNSERVRILNAYLNEVGITDYTIESVSDKYTNPTSTQVKTFIKDNIDQGYPVLLSARKSSTSTIGHAMICYAYDGSNYYGNMGWTSSNSYAHYNITNRYTVFSNAMVLKFNDQTHNHTDNYEVAHLDHNDRYCYCNSNIMTYSSVMTKFDKPDCFNGNFQIPAWLTCIEANVFEGNADIQKVTYETESLLLEIKDGAFSNCNNLISLSLPKNLETIGSSAFNSCTSLSTVIFEENCSLKSIKSNAFMGCIKLQYFQIPSQVQLIEDGVFFTTTSLESVTFSDALTQIGLGAFSGGNGSDLGHITIYTESTEKKTQWDELWNGSINYLATLLGQTDKYYEKRPVFWGCNLSDDKTYVVSINKTNNSIENSEAENGISAPNRYGYTFGGWYSNSAFTGSSYNATEIANAPNGTYYAKWIIT